ncbi:MAG TPA: hypothetical protein ENJ07_00755 [Gammaproteobacteria bacterium]|nr:hypothetical protein [Gammaproteobacteria bacterium]
MITDRFADHLSDSILNQNDPETVKDGVPVLLLLLDSFVLNDPDSPDILQASATLNSTYASVFVEDPERAMRLSDKARDYSRRAICHKHPKICEYEKGPLDQFSQQLGAMKLKDLDTLYTYGSVWAGWIQIHSEDWGAVADLPKVEAIMARIVELDERHEWGRAHLFLGVIKGQLPPALGGKPELARQHFERAIEISEGNDFITKVEFAKVYARLMFDQELHDKLLLEVVNNDANHAGLTLSNTLAQKQAKQLLETSKEYFEE